MLCVEGEVQVIMMVFNVIYVGQFDQGLLVYQYMQMLLIFVCGDFNKVWVVFFELNDVLKGIGFLVGKDEYELGKGGFVVVDLLQFVVLEKIDVFVEIEVQKVEEKEVFEVIVQQVI